MIRESYDVIVVGGGPAGSMAAWSAAEGGVSVLLLEKDRDLGLPVRCAEGVGEKPLNRFIEPDPRWIARKLNSVRFVSPDGTKVDVVGGAVGYILNRRIFDQELGRRAVLAGAQVLTRAYVCGLKVDVGVVCGVKVKFPDTIKEIEAKIVIGADGIESRVGRWAGIKNHFPIQNFEGCYQMVLGGIKVVADRVDCYLGEKVAPGGYAWVFPKSEDTANVGIGVNSSMTNGVNAKAYLERFIEKHFPQASVLACVAGGLPATKPLKRIHGPGVMLAGDAAAHTDPLTGGGITSAMSAGKLAGEIAAEKIKGGDWSENELASYTSEWEKRCGDEHRRLYRIGRAVSKLKDETFNKAAQILNGVPQDERTLKKVFTTTLMHHPKVLLDVIRSYL